MWSRSLIWMGALVLGVQLTATVASRAAARPKPEAPVPKLRMLTDGREAGRQVTTEERDLLLTGPTVAPETLPAEQRLLSDAITSLTRSRDLESEPGGVTRSVQGAWAGRYGVELLAEARDRISRSGSQPAVIRAEVHELLVHAGRAAHQGLRSPDAAVRLTGLDQAVRLSQEAFELLR